MRLCPDGDRLSGEDAVLLAAGYRLTPDPWQELVVCDWLTVDGRGKWASSICGLAVPRQNGKNGCLEIRELFGMVVLGEKILHTAHEVKTVKKAFKRLLEFFDNPREFPELAALVVEVRRTNGQEAIILSNGGSVEFIARTRGSGRGYTVDVLVVDEAQELTDEQLEALKSTISSAPSGNPQTIYTGTPPGPKAPGEVFVRTRKKALENGARLAWAEWSIPDDTDIDALDIGDDRLVEATNPALGFRLVESAVDDERTDLSKVGFARERLGWWQPRGSGGTLAVDPKLWAKLATTLPPPDGVLGMGAELGPDGKTLSLAVARWRRDAPAHVELAHYGVADGLWLVEQVAGLWRTTVAGFAIDRTSELATLLPDLEEAKVRPTILGTQDTIRAAQALVQMVEAGRLTHFDQEPLNAAVESTIRRPIGSAGGWAFAGQVGDSAPLRAVAMALFAARTTRRRPGRKSKVVVS